MSADLYDLARQIIALPGWTWRGGMRALYPSGRGIYLQDNGATTTCGLTPPAACVPDLTDPATAGAMAQMLAEAEPDMEVAHLPPSADWEHPWSACTSPADTRWHSGVGATMGEALARLVLARGGWR